MVTAIQCDRLVEVLPVESLGWDLLKIKEFMDAYCREQYDGDWYYDGQPLMHYIEWRKQVRRRVEDRLRKDREALAVVASSLNVSLEYKN